GRMTAEEELPETKQDQDEGWHEPRFLDYMVMKVKPLTANRILANHRALDEKVQAFRESPSVFGKLPECDYAVPLGAALGSNTDIQLLRRSFTGVDDKSIANTRFRLEMLRSGGISLQLPPELCDVYA